MKSDFFSKSILVLAGSFVVHAFNYAFNIVMGRLMNPEEYGLVVTFMALIAVISVPATSWVLLFTRRCATLFAQQELVPITTLFRFTEHMGWIVGLVSGGIILLFVPWLSAAFHTSPEPFVGFAIIVPLLVLTISVHGTIQGLQEFRILLIYLILGAAVKFFLSVVFVRAGFSVTGVVAALIVSFFVAYVYGRRRVHVLLPFKKEKHSAPKQKTQIFPLLKQAFGSVFVAVLLLTLLVNVDVIFAKQAWDATEAGIYSALSVLGKTAVYVSLAMVSVLVPMISAEKTKGERSPQRILLNAVLSIGVFSVIVTTLFFFFPKEIIGLLFGSAYLSLSPLLWVLGLTMSFCASSHLFIHYFIAVHSTRFLIPLGLVSAFLIVLFFLWGQNSTQIIYIQLLLNAALLVSLMFLFFWENRSSINST